MWSLRSRPAIAMVAAAALFTASAVPPPAYAGLVSTDQVQEGWAAQSEREQVTAFMARTDVRDQLSQLGVNPDEAAARVAAMSDEEVSRLAGHIADAPAGSGAVGAIVGAALIVFLVLLVTDILGFTNVFSFTKSVRR